MADTVTTAQTASAEIRKRLERRAVDALSGGHVRWRPLVDAAPEGTWAPATDGPRVLIATVTGGHLAMMAVEGVLAAALSLRGAAVHAVLCDEALPACLEAQATWYPETDRFVEEGPHALCAACSTPAMRVFADLDVPLHTVGRVLTAADRERARTLAAGVPVAEVRSLVLDGIAVGEHALAGALRFLGRGTLIEDDAAHEGVLRRYLEAALLTSFATRTLMETGRYDVVVLAHAIYVPHGVMRDVVRQAGGRVVAWAAAYRKQTFIFSHDATYHHTLMSEPVETWETMRWTPAHAEAITSYLASRWSGAADWIWFFERPTLDLAQIAGQIGIDLSRPTVGLLTNVFWDAQLHYPANVFENMLQWILETIAYFAKRPDLQLVIRIHPAEVRGAVPSGQRIADEIRAAFPELPANIFVVPGEMDISTYPLMMACDAALIYGTKMGTELTSLGIPVIVAGEAWIRNKGVTFDASSRAHYFALLDRLPLGERLPAETVDRARRYAFHFFFRRMVPLRFMRERPGQWPPFQPEIASVAELLPGRDRGLDVICDGILAGTPFVYPAETEIRESDGAAGGQPGV